MRAFFKSFRHAIAGIYYALREERNFQIESLAAVVVLILMFVFPLSAGERTLLLLVIGFILALELINTAIERLLDMLKPRVHPYVKVIKDLVAGAVLIGTIFTVLIGLIIFLPYWLQ